MHLSGKPDKAGFFRVFRHHFIEWVWYKFAAAGDYWFSSLGSFTTSTIGVVTFFDSVVNLGFLFFTIAIFPLLFLIRRNSDSLIYFWQCSSFYLCCLGVAVLVHFEARYFYALKIYSVFMFIAISAIAWRSFKAGRTSAAVEEKNFDFCVYYLTTDYKDNFFEMILARRYQCVFN